MAFYVKGRPFASDHAVSGSEVIDAVRRENPGQALAEYAVVGDERVPVKDLANRTIPANKPIYWMTNNIEQGA